MFNLPDHARVWIYQSNRELSTNEVIEIQQLTNIFAKNWASHGRGLSAEGAVVHNRFLVLAVDEASAGASGCSIDKSVAFVRDLQNKYQIDLLDRMTFAFRNQKNEIEYAKRDEFAQLYQTKTIDNNTLVFNNLVDNLHDFRSKWEISLADSWHKRMV